MLKLLKPVFDSEIFYNKVRDKRKTKDNVTARIDPLDYINNCSFRDGKDNIFKYYFRDIYLIEGRVTNESLRIDINSFLGRKSLLYNGVKYKNLHKYLIGKNSDEIFQILCRNNTVSFKICDYKTLQLATLHIGNIFNKDILSIVDEYL